MSETLAIVGILALAALLPLLAWKGEKIRKDLMR